jgi:hypothetical protein
MNTTSLRMATAFRIVMRYGDEDPTPAQLMRDFKVSRACAYRWRSAIKEARLSESIRAVDRALAGSRL